MPCYHPMEGYRSRSVNPKTGKRSIVFNKNQGFEDMPVELPCGQCIGCRLERSKQWAIRCVHESTLYDSNLYLTLTYSEEKLPKNGSLKVEDFQLFMKRLRKHFSYKAKYSKLSTKRVNTKLYSPKIRFFHCGEYGDQYNRPHYHAILFNVSFDDKKYSKTDNGYPVYTSETLERLWGHGICTIGAVTFASAAYVARYITKKVLGPQAPYHYGNLKPEYTTMSRNPGIGKPWLDKWKSDIYPDDFVVIEGKQMKVPKFYDQQIDEDELNDYKRNRKSQARTKRTEELKEHGLIDRNYPKLKVAEAKFSQTKRHYENGN